jgi:GTP cyclohydrolase I
MLRAGDDGAVARQPPRRGHTRGGDTPAPTPTMNDMSNLKDALHIPDTQSERDERHLAIQRVGVKGVRYPLQLRIGHVVAPTVAMWALDVALPAEQKGTHMSRFVAWLDALDKPLDASALRTELVVMLDKLHATEGRIDAEFPFFLRKRAPVTGVQSLLEYQGRWIAEARAAGADRAATTTVWAEVVVPVKSLCPCSKEISDYGAHNQRSHVTIRVELADEEIGWQELVRFAEDSASSEIWPMLKRADEKWITERAYENPKFVEDLVRDVALRLNADARVGRYSVDVENFESIHNHSAYARIERS